jgi:hypothetical protein
MSHARPSFDFLNFIFSVAPNQARSIICSTDRSLFLTFFVSLFSPPFSLSFSLYLALSLSSFFALSLSLSFFLSLPSDLCCMQQLGILQKEREEEELPDTTVMQVNWRDVCQMKLLIMFLTVFYLFR